MERTVLSFRLKRSESVPAAIRRLVRERIDEAVHELGRGGEDRHEGVHEARKRLKEIRAVLRLVRFSLGDRFTVENRWYRDTARSLSAARDAQAVVESWDKLLAWSPDGASGLDSAAVRERLVSRRDRLAGAGAELPVAVTLQGLHAARERLTRWPLADGGFAALAPGLRQSYRQGRRRMADAQASGADEDLHEWRKRVKDLWYHTRLLEPLWGEVMDARRRALKALSDALGDDHDLVVLRALLAEEPALLGGSDGGKVAALIERRQRELRAEAARSGALIYAEKPQAYVRRLGAYWRVWRCTGGA